MKLAKRNFCQYDEELEIAGTQVLPMGGLAEHRIEDAPQRLVRVARSLERLGNHAGNICE